MASYDSPIGGKRLPSQQLREFDIPDGEDEQRPPPSHVVHNAKQRLGGHSPQMPDLSAALAFSERLSPEEDDRQQLADMEMQMKAARDAKRTGKTRLNDGARRRIEMLVGMTRTTREFDVGGNAFALQTLNSKEMRSAIMEASNFDGTVQSPFEIRRQLLARSLTQIAGLETNQFVGSDLLEARLEMIDSLDEALLNRLYDEYLTMVNESREKYTVKTQAEAEELAEELKK